MHTRTRSVPRLPLAIFLLGLAVLVCGLDGRGLALTGDRLGSIPDNLDTLLEQALASNPEIIVQEAALEEALAQVNRTRLAVTQQVVSLHFQRRELGRVVQAVRENRNRLVQLQRNGTVSNGEVEQCAIELAQAEGKLARTEAEIRYAIGHGGLESGRGGAISALLHGRNAEAEVDEDFEDEPGRPPIPAAMAEQIDSLRIQAQFSGMDLATVVEFIATHTGINMVIDTECDPTDWEIDLALQGEITLRQLFQLLADTHRIAFFFRDYGIFVTPDADWAEDVPRIPARDF